MMFQTSNRFHVNTSKNMKREKKYEIYYLLHKYKQTALHYENKVTLFCCNLVSISKNVVFYAFGVVRIY